METKRILILGGAGFIGRNLTNRLLADGYDVSILNRPQRNAMLFDQSIHQPEIFDVDLLDFGKVEKIIRNGNFDSVIHLISNLHPGSSFAEFLAESDLNIKISCRLLDLIYAAKVKNFIYFSSGGTVYGNNGMDINKETDAKNPISLYGWYKSAIEQYIQAYTYSYPVNYAILRASNPYGRYQDIYGKQGFIAVAMGNILNNKPINIWGDGSVVRDYIYIDDLTDRVSKLLNKGFKNEIFNVGTAKGHSLKSIIDILKDITQIDFPVIYSEKRNVDVKENILDVSALNNYLGIENVNNTSLRDGMQQMWNYLVNN